MPSHLTDSSGWTHVTWGPHSRQRQLPAAPPVPSVSALGSALPSSATAVVSRVDQSAANARLAPLRTRWLASPCHRQTSALLAAVLAESEVRIERAICVALGSFAGDDEDVAVDSEELRQDGESGGRWRRKRISGRRWEVSASQLVAFESWVEMIRTQNNPHIQVIYQDPAFRPSDIAYLTRPPSLQTSSRPSPHLSTTLDLKSDGIPHAVSSASVVVDPAAQVLVDDHTFLFAPCAEWDVVLAALGAGYDSDVGRGPAVYVGNDLDEFVLWGGGRRPGRTLDAEKATAERFLARRRVMARPLDALDDFTWPEVLAFMGIARGNKEEDEEKRGREVTKGNEPRNDEKAEGAREEGIE